MRNRNINWFGLSFCVPQRSLVNMDFTVLSCRIPKTHDVCSSWLQADIPLKSLHLRGKGINTCFVWLDSDLIHDICSGGPSLVAV